MQGDSKIFSRFWEKKGSSVRREVCVVGFFFLMEKSCQSRFILCPAQRTTKGFHAAEETAFPYNSCNGGCRMETPSPLCHENLPGDGLAVS